MAQSLARLWTHLIFSTKNRFPFLTDKILRAETHAFLAQVLRNHGCETLIVGGVEDHTHTHCLRSREPYQSRASQKKSKEPRQTGSKKQLRSLQSFTGKAGTPPSL